MEPRRLLRHPLLADARPDGVLHGGDLLAFRAQTFPEILWRTPGRWSHDSHKLLRPEPGRAPGVLRSGTRFAVPHPLFIACRYCAGDLHRADRFQPGLAGTSPSGPHRMGLAEAQSHESHRDVIAGT